MVEHQSDGKLDNLHENAQSPDNLGMKALDEALLSMKDSVKEKKEPRLGRNSSNQNMAFIEKNFGPAELLLAIPKVDDQSIEPSFANAEVLGVKGAPQESAQIYVVSEAPPDSQSTPSQRVEFIDTLTKNFNRLAQGKDHITQADIKKALSESAFNGKDAVALIQLYHFGDRLAGLGGGLTDQGISKQDIQALATVFRDRYGDPIPPDATGTKVEVGDRGREVARYFDHLISYSAKEVDVAEKARVSLFGQKAEGIQPTAIIQGKGEDCFFLSSLASMAGTTAGKQVIQNMIKDNGESGGIHTYTVTFPGDPTHPITVPAPTDAEMSIYSRATNYGIWANVMEKAYGQYKKSRDEHHSIL
ncbi:MAG: hypothetical protein HY711_02725, partial [Candidatus Melainabacteria bacterium]|nr:hypothetical protein [Candidatus Melainabacteria bacterium]